MSADSHALEPGDLWTTRMPAKYWEHAPRIVHGYQGQTGDFIHAPPQPPFNLTCLGTAGIPVEEQPKFALGGYAVCRPGG